MAPQIRQLHSTDEPSATTMGHEAFGVPDGPAPGPGPWPLPGRTEWGSFDGDTLAAKARRIAYRSYFGGVAMPTCGLAGVTVAAEYRGTGLLGPLVGQVLEHARAQGDTLTTLFASAPGIYRRYGFELIGARTHVEIPIGAARAVPPGDPQVSTRRAVPGDAEAIGAVYTRWASRQNGPLTRTGPAFPATDLTAEFTGVSLAVDGDGKVLGYASWDRGPDVGPEAILAVGELIAIHPDAYRALWRVLGSFADVAGRVHLRTSGWDPAQLFLAPNAWRTIRTNPYMLRVDDVAEAFTARRLSLDRPLTFAVDGDRLGVMDGVYRIEPDDDGARCRRVSPGSGEPVATYSPGALALIFAGVQSHANVRMLGGLRGPAETDTDLERALGHWPVHIRDSF